MTKLEDNTRKAIQERTAKKLAQFLALRRSGLTLKACGEAMGVSTERARQQIAKAERIERRKDSLDTARKNVAG